MKPDSATLLVQLKPDAAHNQMLGMEDGVLHLRIAARPTEGKANQELLEFLSDILGISKSHLTIEKGLTSRKKRIAISGLTPEQVARRLEKYQQ
ncbi:MAG: DUF167 domain-containing protein [Chloroflexi bacterium]|nr:DUF167 domain-containing protein [Chloroflexota bacterium]